MELKKNPSMMLKKIFIKTFGCQMNEYDSNRILDIVQKQDLKKPINMRMQIVIF